MVKTRNLSEGFPLDTSDTDKFNTNHGLRLSQDDTDEHPHSSAIRAAHAGIEVNDKKITIVNAMLVAVAVSFMLVLGYKLMQSGKRTTEYNPSSVTALVVITNHNEAAILQSIRSFNMDVGKYFGKLIVGCNHNLSIETLTKIGNVQWVFTTKNLDFSFLDQLIQLVQTQYFFYTTTEWHSKSNQFIRQSVIFLSQRQDITEIFIDPTLPTESSYQERPIGFTLSPALHRTANYLQIGGGYSAISGSQCLLSAQCAKKISQFYFSKGLHAAALNFNLRLNSNEAAQNGLQSGIQKKQGTSNQQLAQSKTVNQEKPFASLDISKLIKKQKIDYFYEEQPKKEKIKVLLPPFVPAVPVVLNQIANIQSFLSEGPAVYGSEVLSELKQLPFCLLVSEDAKSQQIRETIRSQKYSNYRIIQASSHQNNYYSYRNLIREICVRNSIVMFLNSPLRQGALSYLNEKYQRFRIFLTYGKSETSLELYSFLTRVFDLLEVNDFQQANQQHLKMNNKQIQLMGLMELCANFTKLVERDKILSPGGKVHFSVARNPSQQYQYYSYVKLLRLSQDMMVNIAPIESWRNSQKSKRRFPRSNLTEEDMLEAVQRQEEWYLPQNNSIEQLEFMEYNKKYGIGQYQSMDQQVRFCLTVLSHNNIQNNRYLKAIESIVHQKYNNYHIVFIDDASSDENLQASRRYFRKVGFPRERITYIKNLHRNYATYNILNAAFNYCKEDEIQMLMDGDDEFIGKYAFQVMNSAYQQNPDLWVAYSNYKTSSYDFGRSLPFASEFEHVSPDNKRLFTSNIGPIRTWRVKLIYNIPAKHHKMQNGQWLDTVYDDALQHPLVELSTIKRLKYINEIMYEYNVKYGDNDDSTVQKINHRTTTFKYILTLDPLKPLATLEATVKDPDVAQQLAADAGIKYVQLQQ